MTMPIATLHQLAFREGRPSDWGKAELNFEISDRICKALNTRTITDDIRSVALAEEACQQELIAIWREGQSRAAKDDRYRGQYIDIAHGLVEALMSPDDPRDRTAVTEQVLEALRPLDTLIVERMQGLSRGIKGRTDFQLRTQISRRAR